MKRAFSAVAVLVILSLLVIQCPLTAVAQEPTEIPLSGPDSRPYEGETLSVAWGIYVPVFGDQQDILIPEYEAISGVKLDVDPLPFTDLLTKLQTMCAAKGDQYDLFFLDGPWYGSFISQDCLEDLDKYFAAAPGDSDPENFALRTFAMLGMKDDKWVVFPNLHATGILAYRTDLFEDPEYQAEFKETYGRELTVPETWEEYLEVGEFFTRDTDGDGETDLWGFNHRYGEANNIVADWLIGFAYARGVTFFDEEFKPTLDSPEAIESAAWFLSPEFLEAQPPGRESFGFEQVMQNMAQGKVAMYLTENWAISALVDPESSKYADKIAFAPVPGWQDPETGDVTVGTLAGGGGMAINANSPEIKRNIAWDFLQFAYGKALSLAVAEKSGSPLRLSDFEDEELVAAFPYAPAMLDNMKISVGRPQEPWWEQVQFIIGKELSAIAAGDKTAEEGMADAQEQVVALVEEAGYYDTPHRFYTPEEREAFACAKMEELGVEHPECQ